MILWNTSKAEVESKFDGKITTFKGGEKKRVNDRVEGQHLLFKLEPRGVVELPDTDDMFRAAWDSKELEPYLIKGLKARRKTLDFVVQNFRTKNKEREAQKLASEPPDDHVINCVKEIGAIDEVMKTLKADDYKLVDEYLGGKTALVTDTDQRLKDSVRGVERDGASGYKVTGGAKAQPAAPTKNGQPRKPAKAGARR